MSEEYTEQQVDAFAQDLKASESTSPSDIVKDIRSLVDKHFGEDCETSIEPFGLQFRKKVTVSDATRSGTSASATVSTTWPPIPDTDPPDTD